MSSFHAISYVMRSFTDLSVSVRSCREEFAVLTDAESRNFAVWSEDETSLLVRLWTIGSF